MRPSELTRVRAQGFRRIGLVSTATALVVLGTTAWSQAAPPPGTTPLPTATRPATVGAPGNPATPPAGIPFNGTAGVPSTQPMAASGQYQCDEAIFSFGEVWSGEDIKHIFIIKNGADTPLEIPTAQPSCGCTVAEWDHTIPPHKEGKVTATVRTKGLFPTEVTKAINLKTSDPKNSAPILQIKGKIKPRVLIDPPTVAFGPITKDTPLTKTVTITNNTSDVLKLEKTPLPQGQAFEAQLKAVEEGKKYELTVTLDKAKLRDGMNYGQINLKTGLAIDPDLYVTVNAMKQPLIDVTPTSIIAIATPTDTAINRDLNITYNGEGTLEIQGEPISSDPAIKATLQAIAPGTPPPPVAAGVQPVRSNYKLSVAIPAGYDPPSPTTQPATVTLKTNIADKPSIEVRVQTFPKRPNIPQVVPESLVGKPAPQQAITDLTGKPFMVGETGGRINVVTFWASWCPHCKKLLPVLQQMSQTYSAKGVDFKTVSMDQTATAEQVGKIAKDLGVTLPTGFDPKQMSGQKYGANRFPMTFLINKNGNVEAVDHGDNANLQLKDQLDALLAGKPLPQLAAQPAQPTTRPVSQVPPNQPNPTLVIDNPTQDIGKHKPGSTGQFNVFVRNGGAQALALTSVTGSDGLKINPEYTKAIPVGGSGTIVCEFTTPKKPGPFSHTVAIASNDPSKPQFTVTLNGTAKNFLELEPAAGVDFGKRPATFSMDRMATITYNGEGAVNYLSADSSSPQFSATIKPLKQGPSVMLLVSAKTPFDIGEHKATITVKTDCKDQPTVEVPVTLYQPPRVDITPTVVSVPKVQRIQSSSVTITNNGSNSLTILGVKSSTDKIRWQFYPEPDGKSYKLNLTLLPGFSASPDGEKVTIKTDDTEFGEIVISVKAGDTTADPAKSISRLP